MRYCYAALVASLVVGGCASKPSTARRALVLPSNAVATEAVEVLSEPVKVAAAEIPNTYNVTGGTYSVLSVELGLFLQSDLQTPLNSLTISPVPAATRKIGTTVFYDVDLPATFVPRDGRAYRLGLRYNTTLTPTAVPTTPSRTPPDPTINCQGAVWKVVNGVFVRNDAATQGRGTVLICSGSNAYGFGIDGIWWKFNALGGSQEWQSTYSSAEPSTLITFEPQSRLSAWGFASTSTVHSGTVYNLTPVTAVGLLNGAPASGTVGWVIK